jgi:hypothetical protein
MEFHVFLHLYGMDMSIVILPFDFYVNSYISSRISGCGLVHQGCPLLRCHCIGVVK